MMAFSVTVPEMKLRQNQNRISLPLNGFDHVMTSLRQRRKETLNVPEKDDGGSGSVFSASARGASYLILLQLFTRLLTFTFNQLILRHTSPAVFGFATIQLELLSSTILFLSREGFRIALQRERGEIQRVVNLAYIPFVTGIFGAILSCYGFWRGADPEVKQLGGFTSSIVLYGIATVLELFIEPCFAVAQQMLLFRVRTLAEGLAVIVRCGVTYLTTMYLAREGQLDEYAALPFGLGQLGYAFVLAVVYLFAISRRVSIVPRRISQSKTRASYWFHMPTLWLAFSVTGQSLFKHLLTEGDKLVLTFLTTPYTQGLYAVVSNYGISRMTISDAGSLVARILFQPLEETLRTILSPLLSSPTEKSLQQSSRLLTTLLRLYLLLALAVHSLIPPLLPTLILPILNLLIGRGKFAVEELLTILYAYLYYIPFMAINGITESVIASVATPRDLAKQSRAMVLFSFVFIAASWGLLRFMAMGGEGLVWANCLNMGVRIMWSLVFIQKWYSEKGGHVGWKQAFPSRLTFVSAMIVGVGIRAGSNMAMRGWIKAFGLAGVGGVVLLACMYNFISSTMLTIGHILSDHFSKLHTAW